MFRLKRNTMLMFGLMLIALTAHAQRPDSVRVGTGTPDVQQLIADIIEDLSSQDEGEQDYSDLTEQLQQLADNPINLATATADQLRNLVFLNDFQIASMLNYRDSLGPVYSIYELMCVPGFNRIDVQRLMPFLRFDKQAAPAPKRLRLWNGRNQLAVRFRTQIETPAGYTDAYTGSGKYLGNKQSYFMRYSYQVGRTLKLGFTAEKDPGEPFFDGTFKTGVDYLSGYIALTDYKRINSLVVGAFDAGFGQGLTFWSGLSFGKSGTSLGGNKRSFGIKPHASAYEAQYLQGVGLSVRVTKQMELTLIGSYRRIDARLTDTLDSGEMAFSSLPETGYHRTQSELAGRQTMPEMVVGGNLRYSLRNARLGLTFVHQQIDGSFDKTPAVYELRVQPMQKTAVGADFQVGLKQHSLFGEAAIDCNGGHLAAVMGGLFHLSSTVQVSLVGRSYSTRFNTRYTSGFAEGSTSNEQGLYIGISLLPTKGWKLSAYADLFRFPWMRYGIYSPSTGRDFLVYSEHSFGGGLSAQVRLRFKQRGVNLSGASNVGATPVVQQTSNSVRLQLNCAVTRALTLKSGFYASIYGTDSLSNEAGYALTQDVAYRFRRLPLQINARFAVFDTPSWNTRIYSYESDMLYSFSVPSYYSKGARAFVLLRYSPWRMVDLYVRYAQTYFSQMEQLGSGADLVNGNTRSEFKVMMRLKF